MSDQSGFIEQAISNVKQEIFYGGILAVIVLFFFLGSIRNIFIIGITIPASLVITILLLYLFNINFNTVSLGSIAVGIGMLLDNAIIVIENVSRYKDSGYNNKKAVLVGSKEVAMPIIASTLTTIAVFLPLIFLTGELKLYFKQFALGIGFNLTASLIVAFTIVPFLYHKSSKNKIISKKESSLSKNLYDIYDKIAETILKWKKLSITILVIIIGLPVWLLPDRIERGVFAEIYNSIFDTEIYSEIKPYINYAFGGALNLFFNHINRGEIWSYGSETYIYVRLELPNGNRIERINQLCKNLENEILVYKKNFKNLIVNVIDEETATLRIEFTSQQSNSAFPYLLKNYITTYAINLGGVDSYVYGFWTRLFQCRWFFFKYV